MKKRKKQRKPKVSKAQTHSGRRNADRIKRAHRRDRTERRIRERQQYKFRVKVIRY